MNTITLLLSRMQENSKPPRPQTLGKIGEQHITRWMVQHAGVDPDSIKYKVRYGGDAVADVVEAAFGIRKDDSLPRQIVAGLNWSAMLDLPLQQLRSLLARQRIEPHDPVVLFLHIARPRIDFTDRGKTRAGLDAVSERITETVRLATKDWKKAKRRANREDRVQQRDLDQMRRRRRAAEKVTLKDAAFLVMETAFNHASDHGRYRTNARQIMYAARPLVQDQTDGEIWKNSSYFTQTLLKDYIEEYAPDWAEKVVWDARGHLTEPHTGARVGLGGREIGNYRRQWTNGEMPSPEYRPQRCIDTAGPVNRYGGVLFIEKEGFAPILADADVAERFDLAIVSTKGMPVGAACEVLGALGDEKPVYVVHDFDLHGFKILNTLRTGTRLTQGRPVIDLGFRLQDIGGLPREDVSEDRKDPTERLIEYGATAEEIDILIASVGDYYGRRSCWRGERVELNAMTSPQFITWLEDKLETVGAKKVVPSADTLQHAYRRAEALQELERRHRQMLEEMNIDKDLPDANALEDQVRKLLKAEPELSWDEAVWRVASCGPSSM